MPYKIGKTFPEDIKEDIVDGQDVTDQYGNEIIEYGVTGSAVNHVGITNAATGTNPVISCEGEANTGIDFENSEGEEILILDSVASSVNEITIGSAATGNNPTIACTGEANTGITFQNSEAEEILILDSVATSVNELTIKSAATGNKPIIAATGEADNGIEFHNDQAEEILILASAATSVNEVTVTSAATTVAPSIAATGDDTNIALTLAGKGTGQLIARSVLMQPQGAPTAETGAATIAAADLLTGIVTISQSTGSTVALTLDTGTAMDTALPYAADGDSLDWYVINLSAALADTATVTAATGHTIVGEPIVESAHDDSEFQSSAHFRSRKTGANTWVTYRLS